jgi:glycosyltransferase involved in cell wall biosynthesis
VTDPVRPAQRPLHVVVVTVAHRGDDARIVHRQSRSLLEAGHRVTLVAPLPPAGSTFSDPAGLERVGVPRATGRRRFAAWRAARSAVRAQMPRADLLVLHDPELLPWFARRRSPVPVVWDAHEDYVASIPDRGYVPAVLRGLLRRAVERVERAAVERCHVLLAEDAYAERLGEHPVVPNGTWVPDEPAPLDAAVAAGRALPRLVYTGRVSVGRGAHELVELGCRLDGVAVVEIIGDADTDVHDMLTAAHRDGSVRWLGYLANPVAIERIRGAFAGLSLLHDEPNYHHSRPTKLVEYLAHGTPVISTPLPLAAELVAGSGGGVLTDGFDQVVNDVVAAVHAWLDDPAARARASVWGHAYVREHHAWQRDGARFVALLEGWAAAR